MSRSVRKTPIIGHTSCRSEKKDKIIWHQRWRSQERNQLNLLSIENAEAYQTIERRQVSNVWSMDKDGKFYFSKSTQISCAKNTAEARGRTKKEQEAIQKRLLQKWMRK